MLALLYKLCIFECSELFRLLLLHGVLTGLVLSSFDLLSHAFICFDLDSHWIGEFTLPLSSADDMHLILKQRVVKWLCQALCVPCEET